LHKLIVPVVYRLLWFDYPYHNVFSQIFCLLFWFGIHTLPNGCFDFAVYAGSISIMSHALYCHAVGNLKAMPQTLTKKQTKQNNDFKG